MCLGGVVDIIIGSSGTRPFVRSLPCTVISSQVTFEEYSIITYMFRVAHTRCKVHIKHKTLYTFRKSYYFKLNEIKITYPWSFPKRTRRKNSKPLINHLRISHTHPIPLINILNTQCKERNPLINVSASALPSQLSCTSSPNDEHTTYHDDE